MLSKANLIQIESNFRVEFRTDFVFWLCFLRSWCQQRHRSSSPATCLTELKAEARIPDKLGGAPNGSPRRRIMGLV